MVRIWAVTKEDKGMTAEECIKLLREIKDVAFATVDKEGHPQLPIIDLMITQVEKR